MPVAEQTDWLDGPRLVGWLKDNGLINVKRQLGGSSERRIRDWKHGARANVYVVDGILVKLGLTLSELPGDLWVDPPKNRGVSERQREEISALVEQGQSTGDVARRVGVDHKTVRRYAAMEATS